ncbi:hypothetical protein P0Y35_13160, partial [Kiritimatiellaeota bacterium B1221]|nr:hypothetical protein [Kiritimatiellaeota bacterium B1221]
VTTQDGDIIIDTATGDTLVNLIRAGAGRGNDLFINAFGGSLLESGADAAADLQAHNVTLNIHGAIQQQGGGRLETWIEDLIAHTTAAGEIELDEVDALILQDVDTFKGFMDIRTGAQLTATDVQSLTDSDANDIIFRATTGDILVNLISAGFGSGDLFLSADAGGIKETAPEDATADLIADVATLTTTGGIGSMRAIETSFNELIASSSVAGNIDFNESDGILLSSVTTQDGNIIIDTATGDIEVNLVSAGAGMDDLFVTAAAGSIDESSTEDAGEDFIANLATLTATGGLGGIRALETSFSELIASSTISGNIDFNETDGILLTRVTTNAGDILIDTAAGDTLVDFIQAGFTRGSDLFINALGGSLFESGAGDVSEDILARNVTLNIFGAIQQTGGGYLETWIDELIAHSLSDGDIELEETDRITLQDIDTVNGLIDIFSGNEIRAVDVESLADSDRNDITLRATSGDILVNRVYTGGSAADMEITAERGGIEELSPDAEIDLRADNGILDAFAGIGSFDPIETDFNSVSLTANNDIRFDEVGSITIDLAQSVNGGLFINVGQNLTAIDLRTLADGSANNIELNVGGVLTADQIIAGANSFSGRNPAGQAHVIIDAGSMVELGSDSEVDIRGNLLDFKAGNIGQGNPLEISGRSINAVAGGSNQLRNFAGGGVNVTQFNGGGTMLFEQLGGAELTLDSVNLGSGNLSLIVRSGAKLNVDQLNARGNVMLRADDMDFTGGIGSIYGTGSISIQVDSGATLLEVNAFSDLEDQAGLLSIDQTDLFAIDFPSEFFLGDVEFILPVGTLGDIGLRLTSGELDVFENKMRGTLFFHPVTSIFSSGRISLLEESGVLQMDAQAFLSEYGFSIVALNGLDVDLWAQMSDSSISMNEWIHWFTSQTGYSPYSLSGFTPSFFSQLIIRLADGTALSSKDTSEVQVSTVVPEVDEGMQPVWVAESVAADEYSEDIKLGLLDRGRLAFAAVPVMLFGIFKK